MNRRWLYQYRLPILFIPLLLSNCAEDKTTVREAAAKNNLAMVKQLIDKGAGVNEFGATDYPALIYAINHKNIKMINLLIENGASVDTVANYRSPLSAAAESGNIEIVNLLLDAGADVNIPVNDSPISRAANFDHFDIVKRLLEKGADVNTGRANGTPLAGAVFHKRQDMLEYLLEKGADPEAALEIAAWFGTPDALKLLLEKSGITRENDPFNTLPTLVLKAVEGERIENLKFLVEYGAPVEYPKVGVKSPLFTTVGRNDLETTRYLVEHGGNFQAVDANGKTLLTLSIRQGNLEMFRYLRGLGLGIPLRLTRNASALLPGDDPPVLCSAAFHNNPELMRDLLELELDINVSNYEGLTPIAIASIYGFHELATLLIESGADVSVADNEGKTPLDHARENDDQKMVDLLKIAGGN